MQIDGAVVARVDHAPTQAEEKSSERCDETKASARRECAFAPVSTHPKSYRPTQRR